MFFSKLYQAHWVRDGREEETPTDGVKIDDILLVRPGKKAWGIS
jgi:cation transport ATPase